MTCKECEARNRVQDLAREELLADEFMDRDLPDNVKGAVAALMYLRPKDLTRAERVYAMTLAPPR